MTKKLSLALCGAMCLGVVSSAQAGLITFETLDYLPPGTGAGSPFNVVVTDQFLNSDDVIFTSPAVGLQGPGPYLGAKLDAFEGWLNNENGKFDSYKGNAGDRNGQQFITDYVGPNPTGSSFLRVDYVVGVDELSFDLIDIDGDEEYTVEIFGEEVMGVAPLLHTITLAEADGGDGTVTRVGWTDVMGGQRIRGLEISGLRPPNTGGFGLAFDNFNTDLNNTVPTPAPLALLALGLVGLGVGRKLRA